MQTAQSQASVQVPVQAAVQWTEMALPISVGSAHLVLRQCQPRAAAPLAQVVVAGAMGVQQSYYQAFARWLAEQGYGVTTFDYRGHGLSLQVPLRDARADLLDWAKDCELVAAQLKQQFPQQPLIWIGHSVGSQLPGLASIPLPINGLLSVGSGSGYWRDNAAPTKRMVRLFWWGVAPLVTALYGAFPGRKLGIVGDLPAGVIWQWRRWCLNPLYAMGVEGRWAAEAYAAAHYPLHALYFEDDEMMSLASVQSLVDWYKSAPSTLERVDPGLAPSGRIGHLGYFKEEMRELLWQPLLPLLQSWRDGDRGPGKPLFGPLESPV
ncbi:alpha/beta fold hydrolase [Comamonas sp. NyZ500]|uniref:alpha/beta hydrolase family protein n=1 Tax=Comamonas sp. NyZ500 TaxID=2795732 RepID=UPI00192C902C|nr:alpha/beta fold hydrolase [Comamonas sp. NyZ500]MBL5976832.1 alpha/beta fold hydrolase [Comamonas sp. NyZ500]